MTPVSTGSPDACPLRPRRAADLPAARTLALSGAYGDTPMRQPDLWWRWPSSARRGERWSALDRTTGVCPDPHRVHPDTAGIRICVTAVTARTRAIRQHPFMFNAPTKSAHS